MSRFRIQSHGRLQEWVAQEKGYFEAEGLDYEFVVQPIVTWSAARARVDSAPGDIQRGAFESIEEGRDCSVSAACHWTVNMAAAAGHGKMWGHAYSVAPSGIFVPPEPPVRDPEDLANVPISVGYHSGSHFSRETPKAPRTGSSVRLERSPTPPCRSGGRDSRSSRLSCFGKAPSFSRTARPERGSI